MSSAALARTGPRVTADATGAKRGRRSSFALCALAALTLLSVGGLGALGVWQLQRLSWKLDLIEQVGQRVHAAPVPVPGPDAWPAVNAKEDAYRRVSIDGRFLHDRETLVQAVTVHGSGFWVVTPMQTGTGAIVLVNRGFVPPALRDRATRAARDPAGEVRVTGLMRMTEPKGGFLRHNDPTQDRWYSRDVPAIAAAHGLSGAAPFFVDADAAADPAGWPAGGLTVVTFSNNHLVYALTWFTLAVMLFAAGVFVARDEWQRRRNGSQSRAAAVRQHVAGPGC